MGNVQTSEQELEEAEKGIVIGTRHDEISNPSSPHSANDMAAYKQHSECVPDGGPTAAGGDDVVFTEVPKPPDGGYGWVIVFASFVCNTIVDGIAYSFGIFMPALVEYFGESTARVAWAGSLLNGVYLLVGPVASGLTNAYGFRTVSIAGSVLASAAFFLSTLVSNVSQLLFVYGILGGIGLGLIYLPAIVAVNYYFETRRALATGIAVCGSGVGTFLFAPLASFLISAYGWRDANLIFGGVILICVLCGLLMRPLVYKKPDDSQKPLLQLMAEERMREMQRGSIVSDNYFLVKLPDGTLERRPKWKMNPDPGVHSSLALNEYGTSPIGLPTITEAARTGSSSSPEEGRANGVVSSSLPDSKMLRPPTATCRTIPAPSPQQNGGTAPASSSTTSTPRPDEDSEKSSDSEKNDVVPELPTGEDRELSRIGSSKRPSSRRGSVPVGESTSSREVVIIKNVSTPLFESSGGSGRRASSGPRAVQPNSSGSSLTMDLRRYSVQNRCSVSGAAPDDVWLCSSTNMSVTSRSSRGSIPRAGDMLRPMSRRDIFYSGSIYHLPQFQSQRSVASYRASVFSMPPHHSSVLQEQAKPGCCRMSLNCSVLKDMLDASLLKSPLFLLICLSNVFGMLGFYVPFVYLVDSAVAKGVKPESAAFLLSVIGITNTLGRVGCGYITDFPCVDALFVSNICIMLSGICTISFPFCFSYTSFVLAALAFGFFVAAFIALTSIVLVDQFGLRRLVSSFGLLCVCRGVGGMLGSPVAAGYIALTSVMLVDLMGIEKLSNSFGLLILFRGASSMLGPPIAGALKDATGDYDASFYAAGVLLMMASVCGFLVPWLRRCVHRSEEDDEEEDVGDYYGGQDHYSSTHQCPASASFINSSEKEAPGSPMTAL